MFNIAINTFKEIIRNKFFYLIIFFAIIFIIFSISLWKLTIWDDSKIIIDFWLAMIELFWFLSVLFVWSQLLFREIEWKTIFLILSKPIKRYEFIIWKFFGFSFCIFLVVFFETLFFLLVLLIKSIEIDFLILFSLFFIFLKLEILLALVFFFSTFMSNILTILVSVMIYFISQSFSLLLDLVERTNNFITINFVKILQLLFPPFEALNLKDVIWSFKNFSSAFFVSNTFYSIFYLFLLLIFTILIFNTKKFDN